jgi:hypothetical protein
MPENRSNELESARLRLGVNKKQMAALLRITPEWYSRVINTPGAASDDLLLRLDQVLRERGLESRSSGAVREDAVPYGSPATRSTCEQYFRERCDEAQESGDPNAWPHLLMLLRKAIPPGFLPQTLRPKEETIQQMRELAVSPQVEPETRALLVEILARLDGQSGSTGTVPSELMARVHELERDTAGDASGKSRKSAS